MEEGDAASFHLQLASKALQDDVYSVFVVEVFLTALFAVVDSDDNRPSFGWTSSSFSHDEANTSEITSGNPPGEYFWVTTNNPYIIAPFTHPQLMYN